MNAARHAKTTRRRELLAAMFDTRDFVTAAEVGVALGCDTDLASKFLWNLKVAGLVRAIGKTQWYLVGSEAAAKAAEDYAKKKALRRPRSAERLWEHGDFVHRVVDCASVAAPAVRSPRWVFDLGVRA